MFNKAFSGRWDICILFGKWEWRLGWFLSGVSAIALLDRVQRIIITLKDRGIGSHHCFSPDSLPSLCNKLREIYIRYG